MKRIHVFLFVVLMLIVAMALCTVIFAACNSPLPDDMDDIEGIEIGVAAMADTSAMPSQTTSVTSFASLL